MPPTPTNPMRTGSIGGTLNSISVLSASKRLADGETPAAASSAGWPGLERNAPSPAAVPAFMNSLRLSVLFSVLFIPPPFFLAYNPRRKVNFITEIFYTIGRRNRKAGPAITSLGKTHIATAL
jgi:hypothetical protein